MSDENRILFDFYIKECEFDKALRLYSEEDIDLVTYSNRDMEKEKNPSEYNFRVCIRKNDFRGAMMIYHKGNFNMTNRMYIDMISNERLNIDYKFLLMVLLDCRSKIWMIENAYDMTENKLSDNDMNIILWRAAAIGNPEFFKKVLNHMNSDPIFGDNKALEEAILNGRIENAKILLEKEVVQMTVKQSKWYSLITKETKDFIESYICS